MSSDRDFNNLLTNSCSIYRISTDSASRNVLGGYTGTTKELVEADVSFRYNPIRGDYTTGNHGAFDYRKAYGYFLPTQDIQEDDIVSYDSEEYIVRAVLNEAGENHHLKILMEKKDR